MDIASDADRGEWFVATVRWPTGGGWVDDERRVFVAEGERVAFRLSVPKSAEVTGLCRANVEREHWWT